MAKKLLIKKIIASFLLVLFAFSITPKKVLHDVLAHHCDIKLNAGQTNAQISKTGFNCQTDNLVVESAFENAFSASEMRVPANFIQLNESLTDTFFSFSTIFPALRGPPVC